MRGKSVNDTLGGMRRLGAGQGGGGRENGVPSEVPGYGLTEEGCVSERD